MIKFLRNFKKEIIIMAAVGILYFLLRLPNLTLMPIFADEAIYIRWAQVMRAEPTLRFLPLSDGKPPLFMWALMPLFKIFDDPLFAGRVLSVISGFFTLLGALFLGWKFFNPKTGLWAAFLVSVVPFMVFFDRMALVDSMLAAFSIWALNLALLLIEYPRADLAMFLGYIMGGAFLTKPPAFFNILTLPVTLVVFKWATKDRQRQLLKMLGLWFLAVTITLGIYNILRLGPGFSNLNTRNQDYIFSVWELQGRPLDPFLPHIGDLRDWLPKMLTVPVLLFITLGLILAFIKRNKWAMVVLAWGLIPLIIQMFLLRTFTARYILFSIPPLLFLAGWGISFLFDSLKLKTWLFIVLALIIILPQIAQFNFYLLTDPSRVSLPRSERRGYLEDWTAGYGLKDIALYLIEESKKKSIVVGTEGSFGTLPDGLQIYFDKHTHKAPTTNQITVIGGPATVSAQIREASSRQPTFYVANKSRFSEFPEGLELIREYPKAISPNLPKDSILFFRVLPSK